MIVRRRIRGAGGWWAVPGEGHYSLIQHTAEFTILTQVELRVTLSIGSGGWTEGLPRYRSVDLATFRVAETDIGFPVSLGFTEGAELNVYLRVRPNELQGEYDFLFRTVVAQVRRMKDEKKAIWMEIICRHGQYDRAVAPPIFPPDPVV